NQAPTGDATNRECQAGRTAEEHSVPNAHANVDRGGACEGGSQNSLSGHERRGRTGTRIAVARSPASDAADCRGDWALISAPITPRHRAPSKNSSVATILRCVK